jgi:metal-responsive CopG/Arc/MetJ family transcriptional regulator
MFSPTVKLNKDLWDKIRRVSDAAGYSSPQEFIQHVLEREVSKLDGAESKEALIEKMKGLGYLE